MREKTAQQYDKYIDNLVIKLGKTVIGIMSIVEECGCDNYEHTGNGYIVTIKKEKDNEDETS